MKTERPARTQKEKDFDITAEKAMRKQVKESEKCDRKRGLNGY